MLCIRVHWRDTTWFFQHKCSCWSFNHIRYNQIIACATFKLFRCCLAFQSSSRKDRRWKLAPNRWDQSIRAVMFSWVELRRIDKEVSGIAKQKISRLVVDCEQIFMQPRHTIHRAEVTRLRQDHQQAEAQVPAETCDRPVSIKQRARLISSLLNQIRRLSKSQWSTWCSRKRRCKMRLDGVQVEAFEMLNKTPSITLNGSWQQSPPTLNHSSQNDTKPRVDDKLENSSAAPIGQPLDHHHCESFSWMLSAYPHSHWSQNEPIWKQDNHWQKIRCWDANRSRACIAHKTESRMRWIWQRIWPSPRSESWQINPIDVEVLPSMIPITLWNTGKSWQLLATDSRFRYSS